MVSQDEFRQPRSLPFIAGEISEGELKTRNFPSDEVHRRVVTDRGESDDSKFKVEVQLVTCVHGTFSPARPSPTSLIVFEYQLHCLEAKHVFKSVTTSFEFSEKEILTRSAPDPTEMATPSVIAYAPYAQRRFNTTTSEIGRKRGAEIAAGAEFMPTNLESKLYREKEESHTQEYFEKSESGRHYKAEEKRHHKVWWKMTQNSSQGHGISPAFRVAILLSRTSDSPFLGTFNIDIDGSFWFSVAQVFDRILGRASIDDPINFDPASQPIGLGELDSTWLGKLAEGAMLDNKLTPVWGTDIGT